MAKTICLLGIDGSGKSTLVKELCSSLRQKNIDVQAYYFGWKPFLPTTKLFSHLFRVKSYRITSAFNIKKRNFSILQEIVLCYFFVEYVARYLWIKRCSVIIFDRYFYDLYAHYSYAERSLVFPLLLRLFPRPDYLYILDVLPEISHQRKPEVDVAQVHEHRNRYLTLAQKLKASILLTNEPVHVTLGNILEDVA